MKKQENTTADRPSISSDRRTGEVTPGSQRNNQQNRKENDTNKPRRSDKGSSALFAASKAESAVAKARHQSKRDVAGDSNLINSGPNINYEQE